MANLTFTATSFLKSSSGNALDGIAGVAISIGDVLYQDSADTKFKLADANSATTSNPGPRYATHIALNTAAGDGQPVKVLASDPGLTLGATSMAAGGIVCLSATPGKMCPSGDLIATDYVTVLGVMTSATVMSFLPNTGGAIPA